MVALVDGKYLVVLVSVSPGHDYYFPAPMAFSHVDRTGYSAVVWNYLIRASTLGRSYAIYTVNATCLASLGILSRFYSPGMRDIHQSLGHVASHQPVSIDVPCLTRTISASRMKLIAQLASHSGPTHIKIWRNPCIRCPLSGNPGGRWGKARYLVPVDCWVFPVDAPTVYFGAARSMLTTGAYVEKYMLVAPDSTMHVALVGITRC